MKRLKKRKPAAKKRRFVPDAGTGVRNDVWVPHGVGKMNQDGTSSVFPKVASSDNGESEREGLLRRGLITPFGSKIGDDIEYHTGILSRFFLSMAIISATGIEESGENEEIIDVDGVDDTTANSETPLKTIAQVDHEAMVSDESDEDDSQDKDYVLETADAEEKKKKDNNDGFKKPVRPHRVSMEARKRKREERGVYQLPLLLRP